jgi:hypothetical protein
MIKISLQLKEEIICWCQILAVASLVVNFNWNMILTEQDTLQRFSNWLVIDFF